MAKGAEARIDLLAGAEAGTERDVRVDSCSRVPVRGGEATNLSRDRLRAGLATVSEGEKTLRTRKDVGV